MKRKNPEKVKPKAKAVKPDDEKKLKEKERKAKRKAKFKELIKDIDAKVVDLAPTTHKSILRQLTRGFYDIQKLRIAIGNRLCANFYSKLGMERPKKDKDKKKSKGWGEEILEYYVSEFTRLADFVSENHRNLKSVLGKHTGIIGSKAEYALVQSYINFLRQEKFLEKQIADYLSHFPIWNEFMKQTDGVGPLMGAVVISEYDIYKADYVTSMWAYAGLDVINGEGRSRKEHHLVPKEYIDADGNVQETMGISFNPFLKTKLLGVLGPQFTMQHKRKPNKYGKIYYDYKQRLINRRNLLITEYSEKMTTAKAKKQAMKEWPDGRIHNAANRYCVKMFIRDLYPEWKGLEGLPIIAPYEERILGMDTSRHDK